MEVGLGGSKSLRLYIHEVWADGTLENNCFITWTPTMEQLQN